MSSFAIYRLPYASRCTLVGQTDGTSLALQSPRQLQGREGFVVAPFLASDSQPILLIRPDRKEVLCSDREITDCMTGMTFHDPYGELSPGGDRTTYAADFSVFHAPLVAGRFQKIVLARCASVPRPAGLSPVDLFLSACKLYPRMFVALVSTPQSGTWLTATPEMLLEHSGDEWRTIALAGTMRLSANDLDSEGERQKWSEKDIREQHYVATYVASCLQRLGIPYEETSPRTVRAADLLHLRSDFTFTDDSHIHFSELLEALHPTPAVCGLPDEEAFRFIISHEHAPRRYYSGYMGPLGQDTHLFVSLRCMLIAARHCLLYAGSGLLKESDEQQEWLETEAKLETMKKCIAAKKTSIS